MTEGKKRIVAIIICVLLTIICILVIPKSCSTHHRGRTIEPTPTERINSENKKSDSHKYAPNENSGTVNVEKTGNGNLDNSDDCNKGNNHPYYNTDNNTSSRDNFSSENSISHHSNYGNSSNDGERNNIGDEPYNNSNNNTENNVSKGHTPSESHTNPDNQNHNSKYQHPEETPSTGDDAIPSQHKRPHDRNTSPGEKNPPKQSNTPNDNDTDKDNDTDNNDPDNEIHPTDNERDSTQGAKPDNRLITPPHEDNWILWLVILIVLLICYIIAKIMSKNGILVIWANKLDKILVIIAAILTFIAILLEDSHNLPDVRIVLYIIAGIMMLVSIIFSIISNLGHLLNIILSILAKLFVFWLINISLFMIIVVLIVSLIFKASDRNRDD